MKHSGGYTLHSMSNAPLSPHRQAKARKAFNLHAIFNALSWNMLVGSIITLFAIRLNASSTHIGALSAMLYASLFFLPLGRILSRRFSIVGIFSVAWIARPLGMIPVVLSPLAAQAGNTDLALGMTMAGVAFFHVTRGIGLIGNTPILSHVASGADRGSYMTQVQVLGSAAGMASGFLVAIILGGEPPLFLYSIIMTAGIVLGLSSGVMIRKLPEPPSEPSGERARLADIFREAFTTPSIRMFLWIFMLVSMISGVARTFVVVYAREAFLQEDGRVLMYTVLGGMGTLLIGMLVKFLIDRIGAKPLFSICVAVALVASLPPVFFPRAAATNMVVLNLFLVFLFFSLNLGFNGAEGIAQTYFLALIPAERTLDMGILYFILLGVSGVVGSIVAGLFLDALMLLGLSPFAAFRILFGLVSALT
ncbi:MAG: MFS transporter, partial [Treponema sp.]|nr:MFS transporter [Treponema sp.]